MPTTEEYDPSANDTGKMFCGFNIELTEEIEVGKYKTSIIHFPSSYQYGMGSMFIAASHPEHQYSFEHLKVYTDDGEHFYPAVNSFKINLVK